MTTELLTPAEMAEADQLSIAAGPLDGYQLMCNAGAEVTAAILQRFPQVATAHVLCGPGNNGGDGYVVARLLRESGAAVRIYASGPPRAGSDAGKAAEDLEMKAEALSAFRPDCTDLVVDALFGAGLSKDIDDTIAAVIERTAKAGCPLAAIDLPSGIAGYDGSVCGAAFQADLTVTFFRKKPGHVLYPGRAHCGDLVVADIGIAEAVLGDIAPQAHENTPNGWRKFLRAPEIDTHKYARGHVGVFSGGPAATGAARLAAMAALRSGAGAATVLSPSNAMLVNASHLTAIMLQRVDTPEDLSDGKRMSAFVIGPGFGVGDKLRTFVLALLASGGDGLVLDADVFTTFRADPEILFKAIAASATVPVLCPHRGEFERVFPDIAGDRTLSKIDMAREAAKRASAVMIFKGADTVIADPKGRAAVNTNGSSWLATAGSGDTLAGICAGLLAQGVPVFEAACGAVWIHADCAQRFGAGMIAEDLADQVPAALRELLAD